MHLTRLATLHRVDPEGSLLVNALSGAVDLVDNETRTKLLQLGLGRDPHFDEATRCHAGSPALSLRRRNRGAGRPRRGPRGLPEARGRPAPPVHRLPHL